MENEGDEDGKREVYLYINIYVRRQSGPGVQAASRALAGVGGRPITVRLILK